MSVVHFGLMIAGVSGVIAPIIIHLLFRQRRKVIKWGAMRYLMEAFRRARKRMRLEQWILLLVRCAIVVLFGLALGRILFQSGTAGMSGLSGVLGGGGRIVYLLVDNGVTSQVVNDTISSENDNNDETALDRFKSTGEDIINTLGSSDRVALLTLGRPTNAVVDPPVVDHGAVLRILGGVEANDSPTDYKEAFNQLRQSISGLTDRTSPIVVYLLSDFYKGGVDVGSPMEAMLRDLNRPVSLYALQPGMSVIDNIGIISVDPVRSLAMAGATDGSGQVRVRLRRGGDVSRAGVSTVRLVVSEGAGAVNKEEGTIRAQQTVRWESGARVAECEFRLSIEDLEPGRHGLSALIGGDRFGADNQRTAVFEVREHLRVGVVDRREFGGGVSLQSMSAGAWFRRALAPGDESTIEVFDIDPSVIEPASLKGADAVIVCRPDLVTKEGWLVLGEFVRGGGLAWLVPSSEGSVALWTDEAREALHLPWVWGREPINASGGVGNDNNGKDGSFTFDEEQPKSGLLRMLAGEISGLVRPIRVMRYLPIEEGVGAGSVVLVLGKTGSAGGGSNDNTQSMGDSDGEGGVSSTVWMAAATPEDYRGLVVYCASPPVLSWTSLPAKPFMVALVQETIRQGLSLIRQGSGLETGDRPVLHVPSSATELVPADGAGLVTSNNDKKLLNRNQRIPIVRERGVMKPSRAIRYQGLYGVLDINGVVVDWSAVDVDPARMVIETQGEEDVMNWLGHTGDWKWIDAEDAATGLRVDDSRSDISLLLLIIVLLLVIAETVLARWFSHAYRRDFAEGVVAGSASRFDTLKEDENGSVDDEGRGAS